MTELNDVDCHYYFMNLTTHVYQYYDYCGIYYCIFSVADGIRYCLCFLQFRLVSKWTTLIPHTVIIVTMR